MKWPALALAAVLVLAGCAKWGPPLEQRTTHGPTARQFWALRMMLANDREPTLDERRHWEDQIEIQIQPAQVSSLTGFRPSWAIWKLGQSLQSCGLKIGSKPVIDIWNFFGRGVRI